MKTSVKNLMMSFALMGCLIIGASDASAQGRSRSQGGSSSRSQSAAVSRSSQTPAPRVSRSSSSDSRSSSATPQVNRSTGSNRPSTTATPDRTRTRTRTDSGNSGITRRDDSGAHHSSGVTPRTDRNTPSATPGNNNRRDNNRGTRPGGHNNGNGSGNVGPGNGNGDNHGSHSGNGNGHSGGNGGNHGNGDNHGGNGHGNGHGGGNVGPGNGGNHSGNHSGNGHGGGNVGPGHDRHDGHGRPNGGNHSYNPNHRYDYNNHPHRDQFSWNHSHHNWSRPLPPPVRAHRPAPMVWRRPVIPSGWHPYAGAPVIDRILGIMFGTFYDASLDYLYNSGYYIDGYADGIIYLRDVTMLDLYWPDVMLNYEYNKLVNAQFVYHSSYYDRSRFNRVYRSLCRIYGSPVFQDSMTISWYGGRNTGWVTLTMTDSYGDYYTTMSIGY